MSQAAFYRRTWALDLTAESSEASERPRIAFDKGSVYATAQRMASALADDDLPAAADASVRAATPALRRRGGSTIGTITLP
ncbi:hypothetical protein E3T46_05405 [Cryobacterium sp. Hh11]|uniref:hypothetical protein n=1 Tax=Cryobacterium sp. Hh11 TaxID=2555868 RepID=UPI00106D773F|nr:hypothetical protein [Cryobacterium sp. Hh11]TFD52754.1 hypothetical protein E3T46_05405 [Cryobacterium sp. Hh11]